MQTTRFSCSYWENVLSDMKRPVMFGDPNTGALPGLVPFFTTVNP